MADMWNRMRAMSDGQSYDTQPYSGGLIGQQASQYPTTLPPAANPMAGINPMYTRQMPQNSLAPMGMYQAYKQTGQMPAETDSFSPMAPTAQPGMMGPTSQPAAIPMGNK